ncbi:WXG100 family type VII secretion target [Actinocrispum sp. NPDC049592]|uniref:WXG100 family type VII secretion target n=1 Tax=Actinocrispum sp. NPDC049592 TaxID=3154835 RepID=UPI0034475990
MPDGIKVDFAAVEAAGSDITSTFNKMTSELDTLKQNLAPLRAAYTGEAQVAWDNVQRDWEKSMAELAQILSSIGTAVSQAAQDYQQTEHGVKRLWGQ